MSHEATSSLPPGKAENVRRCCRGHTNLIWHVTDNVAHLTVPDLTCTIRTDIITLEGVYQLELNRFDAASRYVRWQQPLEPTPSIIGSSHPNAGQKQALCTHTGQTLEPPLQVPPQAWPPQGFSLLKADTQPHCTPHQD